MTESGKVGLRPLVYEEVTDWYIPETEGQQVLVYPGAIVAKGDLATHAKNLRDNINWRQSMEPEPLNDWRVEYRGLSLRARRQRTVDGIMYILRRISTELPELVNLGLPPEILKMVTSPAFGEQGGLVLVTGGPGHGKSTTLAAILLERVRQYGFFCLTVEDPPEFALHNDYLAKNGRVGKIVQVPAENQSFATDLKDALRCYPSNMRGSMLMVGEVRDGDAAAQILRAAVNGQLVFTTLHAADPIAALERILTMAKEMMSPEEARSLLAHSLRAVLQQRVVNHKLSMEYLVSTGPNTSVAARIKSGSLAQLSTDLMQQRTQAQNGRTPSAMSR
jgi:Tfp pilus assembly pilus retraction ATPase PilT